MWSNLFYCSYLTMNRKEILVKLFIQENNFIHTLKNIAKLANVMSS